MSKSILIGCDLHDRSMLTRYVIDQSEPAQKNFVNDSLGRQEMIDFFTQLAEQTQAKRIVFVYEASGQGFGLSDLLEDHGIECHVLSPNRLEKTPKSAKQKTDAKDAQMLLEKLRGFVLAGNELPAVWVPPQRLRDDRELVRCRIDIADESTRLKQQIITLLKRRGIQKPDWYSTWSKRFVAWLYEVAGQQDSVVASVLEGHVRGFEHFRDETARLDREIRKLSRTSRYVDAQSQLQKLPGVGLLTAMTFLTEMGDLTRFHNRREVGAYLGLAPASYESGNTGNRKGRITRQGPARLRRMLCQAAWVSLGRDHEATAAYERVKGGKPQRNKKAIVALMRRLGIKMWHQALDCGVPIELLGRGDPHQLRTSARAQQRGPSPFVPPSPRPLTR